MATTEMKKSWKKSISASPFVKAITVSGIDPHFRVSINKNYRDTKKLWEVHSRLYKGLRHQLGCNVFPKLGKFFFHFEADYHKLFLELLVYFPILLGQSILDNQLEIVYFKADYLSF